MAEKKQKAAKIPGYKAVSVLGKGAQGVVYKGIDEKSKAPVAIKVLSPNMAKIPEFKARFEQEAEISLTLSHPNIVKALSAGSRGSLLYYVMEFARGKDLHDVVAELGPLSENKVVHLGIQAADALAYAHENRLIHRDVKPGNIMIAPDWTLKLLDLGLAKDQESGRELTMEGSVFGTANYISPEAVHDSKVVDARSDVYSLGATLYKAATGTPPFDGPNAVLIMSSVCKDPPKPPRQLNPKLSEGLERILLCAMAKKPEHRYGSCKEMKADFERLKRGEKVKAKLPPKGGSAPPAPRKKATKSGRIPVTRRQPAAKGFFGRLLAMLGLGEK